MKQDYLRHILLFLCLFAGINAYAYDAYIDGIYYNFSGDKATVTYKDRYSSSYSGSVVIPEFVTYNDKTYSVDSIGNRAFVCCLDLISISIPNGVTAIGYNAFSSCFHLTTVTIPNSVTSIDGSAFSACSGLTSVTIGNSVTSIGSFAFSLCSSLTSIIIPNSVTSIGLGAFHGCTGLTSVTIPNSVKNIKDEVFSGCDNLTSIKVEEDNPYYDSRNDCNAIIETATNTLVAGCMSTIIPDNVTSIGFGAFERCIGLISISIPNSVTSIGHYAFYDCNSLSSVKMGNAVPVAIEDRTFSNRANATLYVPNGSKTAYESAPYWSEFKEIIELQDNGIYMADTEIVVGTQIVLPIAMKSLHEITGLQMDLYLPEGIAVAKNSRGKLMIAVTDRMDGNYTVSGRMMDGGFVRIAGFSPDNDAFTGYDGDILNVTLEVADTLTAGDYTIQLKNIVLSDVNNTEYHPTDTTAAITVYAQGDVDGSGAVNINDVVCIINYILNRQTGTFLEKAADVDGSGSININDVVVLIDRYILSASYTPKRAAQMMADAMDYSDRLFLDDQYIEPGETVEIAVQLNNTHDVKAVQGNIKLPEGFSFVTKSGGRLDVKNLNERSEDFTLSCALQADGSMTFTQYSIDGFAYEGSEGGIFTFKVTADANVQAGSYEVALTNVVLSIDGKAYEQPDCVSFIDGIEGVRAEDATNTICYDIQGRKLSAPRHGINIVHMSDGSTRKVFVK